jgi:heme exporter protein D
MPDFDMSPYAAYVWPAWGVSALVLLALGLDSWRRARRWRRAAQEARPEREP